MTTATEAEILTELIGELQEQVDDPFCDDPEQAANLLANAKNRLRLLEDGSAVDGTPLVDEQGARYVVNDGGFGEPDISSPNPGAAVLEPKEVKALEEKTGVTPVKEAVRRRAASKQAATVVDKSDFDEVVQFGAKLGVSANEVHAQWAAIQKELGDIEFDKCAYLCLKACVLNQRLQTLMGELESTLYKFSSDVKKTIK